MGKNTAVFGIYKDTVSLGQALERLRSAGFRSTDVSVLMPENLGTKDLAAKKETKAPEGATTGGVTGGVIGGALGWLAPDSGWAPCRATLRAPSHPHDGGRRLRARRIRRA